MERRTNRPGRRASDRVAAHASGTPAWMRIAVLGLALAATGYVLLVSREVTRPTRDVHRLEAENQILSTRLAAEQVAALARAGNTDAKPEIRLVSAADATMRVVSAQGAVLASDRPDEVGRASRMPRESTLIEHAHGTDPRADHGRGEPRPDDLDLGKFRHSD